MRRQDKAKNMRRVNMLFEQRCNEYDESDSAYKNNKKTNKK